MKILFFYITLLLFTNNFALAGTKLKLRGQHIYIPTHSFTCTHPGYPPITATAPEMNDWIFFQVKPDGKIGEKTVSEMHSYRGSTGVSLFPNEKMEWLPENTEWKSVQKSIVDRGPRFAFLGRTGACTFSLPVESIKIWATDTFEIDECSYPILHLAEVQARCKAEENQKKAETEAKAAADKLEKDLKPFLDAQAKKYEAQLEAQKKSYEDLIETLTCAQKEQGSTIEQLAKVVLQLKEALQNKGIPTPVLDQRKISSNNSQPDTKPSSKRKK